MKREHLVNVVEIRSSWIGNVEKPHAKVIGKVD